MLIPFGVLSAAAFAPSGDYELIASEILTTTESSITFSNLGNYSSTYKHLQLRATARTTDSSSNAGRLRFNADTGTNYARHLLRGNGTSVGAFAATSATGVGGFIAYGTTVSSSIFGASVTDILDYSSTTKNKTIRQVYGGTNGQKEIALFSGAWFNTAPITSITAVLDAGSFPAGCRFSLYGIRG
jgi:hypothetical protein